MVLPLLRSRPAPIRSAEGVSLPHCVQREFDDHLKCGLLEHGFLRVKCDARRHERLVAFSCKRRGFCPSRGARRMVESAAHLVDHAPPEQPIRQWVLTFPYPLRFLFAARPQVLSRVLGVVYRAISTYPIKKKGFTVASGAKTGAVTPIRRFGSALNLNIHFHVLFLDGVYDFKGRRPTFHRAPQPTRAELTKLLRTIGQRVARSLERLGLLARDADSDHLDFEPGEAFDQLVGASIHYRIAIGPNAGRKALTSRTVPVQPEPFPSTLLAGQPGFSLHAATVCEAAQRDKLEKLCRHIARPAIANERLSTNDRGQVIYRFKQPFRDGSTHVVLDPLDFIARPAALVPRPRSNLTRFHGVFAPNCKHRESVVPKRKPRHEKPDKPLAPMTRMRRLKRVFAIDIETCPKCGGPHRKSRCHRHDPRARSCSRGGHNHPCESTSAQHRAPRRANTRTAPVENDRPTPCCDRYTSNRRFARPFRLQRPPPHPQRAQRTPLKTSPERPVNQPYFATIPFRAVIRPIRSRRSPPVSTSRGRATPTTSTRRLRIGTRRRPGDELRADTHRF